MSDGVLSDGSNHDDLPQMGTGDLFGDGSVIKTVLKEGDGWENPKDGEEVRISFKITASDGALLDEKNAVDHVIGSDDFGVCTKLIDQVLGGMVKEEKCSLKCTRDSPHARDFDADVVMELELEEQYSIVDCSVFKDGSAMKKTIKEAAEYDRPRDGGRATVNVEAVTDGSTSLAGFEGAKLLTFTCGSGEVCDALEGVVVEMSKGERALLTCERKYRDVGLGVDGMSVAKVVLTLELVDFEKGQDMWNMSNNEKIVEAMLRKDIGAELFKAKRFELAWAKYEKVTGVMSQQETFNAEQKEIATELKQTCELNKAACYLQLGEPTSALASCNLVLLTDRNNVKALLRRSKAHFSRNEHADAIRDVNRVLELEPAHADAKALLPQMKRAAKALDGESKSTFAKMCKGFGKLPERKEAKEEPVKETKATSEPEEDPDLVTVTFRIEHKPQEGEVVHVYGAADDLGAWDLDKSVAMRLLPPKWEPPVGSGRAPPEHFIWEAILKLPEAVGRAEYKYVIKGPGGDRAEKGSNHKMDLAGMGGTRMKCTDSWRDH